MRSTRRRRKEKKYKVRRKKYEQFDYLCKGDRERVCVCVCVLIPQNYPIIINELHLAPMDLGCDKT